MATEYVVEPASAKVDNVAELRELVGRTQAAILTDYRGLSVAELTELRQKLRGVDAEFRVVKNTLFKRAAEGLLPVDQFDTHLSGPTGIGFAQGDAVGAAKVLVDFAKDHKALSVKVGIVGQTVYDAGQVEALSKTPPREVLIAQMLGSLNGPISGFVGTLSGIISNFVFTLQAVADKQTGEAAA
jgi:large subunit ribosomal protein L10